MGVRVQIEPFDGAQEYDRLAASGHAAVAVFSGQVRDFGYLGDVSLLELEHYPGMTERVLTEIGDSASARFSLLSWRIIHRYGPLKAGEAIVWVGVTAHHREAAFAGCEFIMDHLKTNAPFWKKERHADGKAHWVAAADTDEQRRRRWHEDI